MKIQINETGKYSNSLYGAFREDLYVQLTRVRLLFTTVVTQSYGAGCSKYVSRESE